MKQEQKQMIPDFNKPLLDHINNKILCNVLYEEYEDNLKGIYLRLFKIIYLENEYNSRSISYENNSKISIITNGVQDFMYETFMPNLFIEEVLEAIVDLLYDNIYNIFDKLNLNDIKHQPLFSDVPLEVIKHIKNNYKEYHHRYNNTIKNRDSKRHRDSKTIISMLKEFRDLEKDSEKDSEKVPKEE